MSIRNRMLFPLLGVVWLYEVASSGVPGCDCNATTCAGDSADLLSCSFAFDLEEIDELDSPICDAVDASPIFQERYGVNASTYYFVSGGETTGPWDRSGYVPLLVGDGTCEEAFEEQNKCPEAGDLNYTTRSISMVEPQSCTMLSSGDVAISIQCRSWSNSSIPPWEGSMDVYIQTFLGEDESLCDKDLIRSYSPKLTSADWIEPESGRRYMCYDAFYNDKWWYAMVMNMGNQPCRGPDPATPDPGPPEDDDSAAFALMGRASLRGSILVAAMSLAVVTMSLISLSN